MEAKNCPECGAAISPDVGCPQCLLGLGLPETRETASLAGEAGGAVRIGPYTLLDVLGEGGMGVVYLAQQERPLRRLVALKLVKPGMDSKHVIARFDSERQALAMLDHVGIARVYDAGTNDQGRPYFVMEHVAGLPITQFCDRERLSIRQRLDLFVRVCEAVQHAHQKGIIHRDLKPSNVLVSFVEGEPVPKVIDFGVAKATNHRLTERTLYTGLGGLVGTPEYMSPEQADPSALDIDTRTDVYSLGVLLHELLVGVLPYGKGQERATSMIEMQRILREEEMLAPSTRVSEPEADPETARRRRTDPRSLASLLRGDLDWIVGRSLEKERARRYPSASELGADVERFLAGEVVVARPPSVTYRLSRFVKRHRVPVVAAATILVTIVVLGSVAFIQGMRARRQALAVRANSILLAASEVEDPLIKALLLEEVDSELPGALAIAHDAASSPLPIRLFRGHRGQMTGAVFSPGGERIVTTAADGLRIWHIDGGEETHSWAGHEDWIRSIALSADGTHALTASDDGTARLWRIDGGAEKLLFEGHEDWLYSAAFSPDGSLAVTASRDGTARVWRTDGTGTPVVFRDHGGELRKAEFSPDGTQVISASLDGTARIWAADGSGDPVVLRHDDAVLAASFSPLGDVVATASADGSVHLWSIRSGQRTAVLRGHEGAVFDVRFSPAGTRLVTASEDRTARIWALDGRAEPIVLRGHEGPVSSAVYSSDGSRVVTASADGTARVWPGEWDAGPRILMHEADVNRAVYSHDGSRVVTSSKDGTARIWRADGDDEPIVLDGHTQGVNDAAFSPDGSLVATASEDRTVRLWHTDGTGAPVVLRGHAGGVLRIVFGPRGKRLATGSKDGTARVWRVDDPTDPVILDGHVDGVLDLAFSPDGTHLATASNDGSTRLWRSDGTGRPTVWSGDYGPGLALAFHPRGQQVAVAHQNDMALVWSTDGSHDPIILTGHQDWVRDVAFSPDGDLLVTASDDFWARVWPTDGREEPVVLSGHRDYIYCATFSPGGEFVLTASRDGTARIWRADGVGDPVVLAGHTGEVVDAVFSPDGTHVVTASADGTARIWLVSTTALLARLRGETRTCLTPEQRMRFLLESRSKARTMFGACERRHGRGGRASAADRDEPAPRSDRTVSGPEFEAILETRTGRKQAQEED